MSGHDWNPREDDPDDSPEPESPLSRVDYGGAEPSAAEAEPAPAAASDSTAEAEPRRAKPGRKLRAPDLSKLPPVKRETRVGAAALLSFVILLVAFIVNRGRTPKTSGKPDPGKASGTQVAIQYDPETTSPPKSDPAPEKDEEKEKEPEAKAEEPPAGDPPLPPPSGGSNDPEPGAVKRASVVAPSPLDNPPETSPKPADPDEPKAPTPPASAATKTETPPVSTPTDQPAPPVPVPVPVPVPTPDSDVLKPPASATADAAKSGPDAPGPASASAAPELPPVDPPKSGAATPPANEPKPTPETSPAAKTDTPGPGPDLPAPTPIPVPVPVPVPIPANEPTSIEPPKPDAKTPDLPAPAGTPEPAKDVPKPLDMPPTLAPIPGGPATPEPKIEPPAPAASNLPSTEPVKVEEKPKPAPDAPPVEPSKPAEPAPSPFDQTGPKTITSRPAGGDPSPFDPPSSRVIQSAPAASSIPVDDVPATAAARRPKLGPGWTPLRSLAKPKAGAVVAGATAAALAADGPDEPPPRQAIPDAPPPKREIVPRDDAEPVLHTVARGENFWTISRLYYGSGRYYKALWNYNVKLVPRIAELYVGTTIKVPPPEFLDASLIEAPQSAPAPSRAERVSTRNEPAPATPKRSGSGLRSTVDPDLSVRRPSRPVDDVDAPVRPTYRVRPYDTLRGIAKQTLGDARRDREILELNRGLIDDPRRLVPGQNLVLPEDAVVGTRLR